MSAFQKLKELLPANRVAAIVGFLTAIGAALVSLETSFVPGSPGAEAIGKAVAIVGSLAAAASIVLKFLDGAQNWESLMVTGSDKGVPTPGVVVVEDNPHDVDLDGPEQDVTLDPADAPEPVAEGADVPPPPEGDLSKFAGQQK